MNLNKVPAGKNLPDDIYVIIEIKANDEPVKYEIDKKTNNIFVDRFISTAMLYPCNYGYINNTLSLDGDPLDVLVQTMYSLQPGSVILCRPVGLLNMIDESGQDKKILAVPHTNISTEYDYIRDIEDIPKFLKSKIIHFFEHYKDLEKGKWVKINGWENVKAAKNEILSSFERANKNK